MEIVGVIPAAGHATRLQPISSSKEVYPIAGRPVMDFLVDRMRTGGATQLRVVTRPEKQDVVAHAEAIGAAVVLARPETVSESLLAGMSGVQPSDIVLIGFPDTLWEPKDGYRLLVEAVKEGSHVALGLFRIEPADLPRSDVIVFDEAGRVIGIDVKPARPQSEWVWGCAAARAKTLADIASAEWPGAYFDRLCRLGLEVRGIEFSDVWLDIGTKDAIRRAEDLARKHGNEPDSPAY